MTIPTAEHLFEQAEKLIAPPSAGPRRQVDLRRAISSAHYGLFHFALMSVADEFVGAKHRATGRYALVYRHIQHRTLKDTCIEAVRPRASGRYAAFIPAGGFRHHIHAFALSEIDLQQKRHTADYAPQGRFKTLDATVAINSARIAVQRFPQANQEHRRVFLTLLFCPPR